MPANIPVMNHSSSDTPSVSPASTKREQLSLTTKLAFGAGDMGPAITANVLVFFLLYFFTQVAGLPPGLAGSILMIGKISDAINDPVVGILSDRTRSRWGRRLPWMLYGAIPFGILFVLQWIVPQFSDNDAANNWWLFAYYILIGILFNIAFTAVNLPYTALTPELTQDYNERTSLNSFRFAFSIGGSILSLVVARVIFGAYPEDGLQQYFILGLVSTVISVIAIFWCILGIQERGARPFLQNRPKKNLGILLTVVGALSIGYGIARLIPASAQFLGGTENAVLAAVLAMLIGVQVVAFGLTLILAKPETNLSDRKAARQREQVRTTPTLSFREQLQIAFQNKPFLSVIGIYLCSWLGVQLTASVLPYFVVSWMGLSDATFTVVALAVQGTALVMLFFWNLVSARVGKRAVYFMGMSLWIVAQAGLFFLQPGQIALMYVLAVLAGFGVSVAYLIPWSMVPDVIELDELNTGQRREGIFYGFMVLLQKIGLALGLFLVGQALELAGFIESAAGEPAPEQPASALLAIRIAIGPLPTLFLIIGLILAYFYPITREVHSEILLRLREREE